MAQERIVEGLVLRRWNAQETDKWVSFLTPDHGKLRLRVRGAHKQGSKMGMLSEPLNILRTRVVHGRNQQLMVQPQMVATFLKVRGDLERLSAALALMELLDRWLPEEHAEPLVYETALAALNALEAGHDVLTVMGWTLWRLLRLFGYCPELDACARCQNAHSNGEWWLNPADGRLLCARCTGSARALPRLTQAQLATLRGWLQQDPPVGEGGHVRQTEAQALLTLAVRYAEHYLDDPPRWLEFLTRLNALPATVQAWNLSHG
ncbi:MAG: DNA repair protein RecO [Fimbriimonadales bacterium]|nr:DNA repair protein RecO [Fimbriimonadales bacterium]